MNNEQDAEKLLSDHRRMLMLSGSLSSFQIENLSNFPKVVFNSLDKFEVNYDFYKYNENGDKEVCAGKVVYNIFFKKDVIEDEADLRKRAEALKFFVKSLFWQDTKVEIRREGSEWI